MHAKPIALLLCGAAATVTHWTAAQGRPLPLDVRQSAVVGRAAPDTAPDTVPAPDTVAVDERLAAFNARRATNRFGHYLTGEQIRQHHGARLSDLLQSVPGVTLAPSTRVGNLVRIRGCQPLLWMDGVRLPDAELDEVASPTDVAGLEVYSAPAGVPARYVDRSNRCGTLLVWTRSG